MRNLTLNETLNVSAAGYAEDITATAATLYVGSCLYGVGLGAGKALSVYSLAVMGKAATPFAAALALSTPALALAVPAVVAGVALSAHPELETALIEKFHSYFG